MTPFAVHAACIGLVGADMMARGVRIRLLVARLGGRLSVGDSLRLNLLGDATAEMTPFRIAGEPSRVAALLLCGVSRSIALLSVGVELVLSYAMLGLVVAAASWATLPTWWATIRPSVQHATAIVPLSVVVLLAAAVVLSLRLVSRRSAGRVPRLVGLRASVRAVARIDKAGLVAVLGLSGVNIAARVAILSTLVSALPGAPPASTVLVGSFVLLFGQAFAPTPSGLGVVELGLLGGAAGMFGPQAMSILLYWRVYTAVLPILLALIFAVPRFGGRRVLTMLGLRRKVRRDEQTAAATLSDSIPGAL